MCCDLNLGACVRCGERSNCNEDTSFFFFPGAPTPPTYPPTRHTHWSITHWEFKAGPDLVLVHVSGCFADMLSMLCYAMLSMLCSKGPGAPTLTGAAHSLSTRRVCTCVAFREKDPRARSVVVFSLNTDARGLLPERPTPLAALIQRDRLPSEAFMSPRVRKLLSVNIPVSSS